MLTCVVCCVVLILLYIGMGPIGVAAHLAPFLPSHPWANADNKDKNNSVGAVSAAPYSSAAILVSTGTGIEAEASVEGIQSANNICRGCHVSVHIMYMSSHYSSFNYVSVSRLANLIHVYQDDG